MKSARRRRKEPTLADGTTVVNRVMERIVHVTIIPFHGILYDPALVGDIKSCGPSIRHHRCGRTTGLHDRHPQNMIRLELGLDQTGDSPAHNRYTRAAATLATGQERCLNGTRSRPSTTTRSSTPRPIPSGSPTKTLREFLPRSNWKRSTPGISTRTRTHVAAKTDRLNLLEACSRISARLVALFRPSAHHHCWKPR